MSVGLLGNKIGMTQIFDESGNIKIYTHEGMIEQSNVIKVFPRQVEI